MGSGQGARVPEQVSPRGTYLKIAEAMKSRVQADATMTELPSLAEIMNEYGVSRGVAIRAVNVLKAEGIAEPVPGARWRAVRDGGRTAAKSLVERIAAVVTDDGLEVGAEFPSTTVLCGRFGVSRPTVRRALDKLAADGLLSEGTQGKTRTVLALPDREGRSTS